MDDDITFDNPAAVREMRQRHAQLGRRVLVIVDYALRELEAKIAKGEPLNMSREDALKLREVGAEMIERAALCEGERDGGDALPDSPKKPN